VIVPVFRVMVLVIALLVLPGCGSDETPDPVEAATETLLPVTSPTPLVSSQVTTVPISTDTLSDSTLTIWWPDEFYPADVDVLEEQIRSFALSQGDTFEIELRRKPTQGNGGIVSTLASASAAAPGALPDLTLMRYREFVNAVQNGTINPMDDVIRIGLMDDIYVNASALTEVEEAVYGLPYALDLFVLVTHDDLTLDSSSLSFEDIQAIDGQWAFPGGRLSGISMTLYLQYLSISGFPVEADADGDIVLNADALDTLFTFYETSQENGTIASEVPQYAETSDYELSLVTGDLDAGVMFFSDYLLLSADNENLRIASIPTVDGEMLSVMDSWMWVMPNESTQSQVFVAAFLEWMMEPARQQDMTAATNTLPSQQTVLNSIETNRFDVQFVDALIDDSVPPPVDISLTTALRTVQSAVMSIIRDEASAGAALQTVQEQLDNG